MGFASKYISAAVPAFIVLTFLGSAPARADLLNFGSTYNVTGSDFAGGDFNQNLTLSASPQTFNSGTLQINETTTAIAGGAEWVEFNITSLGGAPLVSSSGQNGYFSIYLNNLSLTAAAVSSNYYFDFTTNGTPNGPLSSEGTLTPVSDPNPGSLGAGGQVLFFSAYTPGPASSTTGYGYFETPYAYDNSFDGTDDNANGYFLGFELTPAVPPSTAPEPAALFLVAPGLLGLLALRRRVTG